jgi:arabinogalactan oligomer/maltooligosaccharide transport system permease protein
VLCGFALGQVWLIKGFFDAIPRSLDEAATMDGAGHATIFFRIILPLITPILAVSGCSPSSASSASSCWRRSSCATRTSRPSPSGLFGIIDADRSNNLGLFAAGSLLTALPVVLLFQYLQRYIVGGLTAGGVKG